MGSRVFPTPGLGVKLSIIRGASDKLIMLLTSVLFLTGLGLGIVNTSSFMSIIALLALRKAIPNTPASGIGKSSKTILNLVLKTLSFIKIGTTTEPTVEVNVAYAFYVTFYIFVNYYMLL